MKVIGVILIWIIGLTLAIGLPFWFCDLIGAPTWVAWIILVFGWPSAWFQARKAKQA